MNSENDYNLRNGDPLPMLIPALDPASDVPVVSLRLYRAQLVSLILRPAEAELGLGSGGAQG